MTITLRSSHHCRTLGCARPLMMIFAAIRGRSSALHRGRGVDLAPSNHDSGSCSGFEGYGRRVLSRIATPRNGPPPLPPKLLPRFVTTYVRRAVGLLHRNVMLSAGSLATVAVLVHRQLTRAPTSRSHDRAGTLLTSRRQPLISAAVAASLPRTARGWRSEISGLSTRRWDDRNAMTWR